MIEANLNFPAILERNPCLMGLDIASLPIEVNDSLTLTFKIDQTGKTSCENFALTQ